MEPWPDTNAIGAPSQCGTWVELAGRRRAVRLVWPDMELGILPTIQCAATPAGAETPRPHHPLDWK